MDTDTQTVALDAIQLKALRNAKSIVFRFDRAENLSVIEATKEHDPGDGFGKRELHQTIACLPTKVSHFSTKEMGTAADCTDVPDKLEVIGGCWVFTSAQFRPELVTAFSILRPGDELQPHFIANNVNTTTVEAGLTVDELKLEVVRRKANKRLVFLLESTTYSMHSPVRNVRFGPRS